jgi:hypothetical protein
VYKSIILAQQHIDFTFHGLALIHALALRKVMLIAKDLHLGERFNDTLLIYPTLLQSGLFAVGLACFKILEDAAVGFYRGSSFPRAFPSWGEAAGRQSWL